MGDAGVGGGGCGGSSGSAVEALVIESGAGDSVSVSEPEDSRSQLSATGLDFGLCRGFCGAVVESFSLESVSTISAVRQWRDACCVGGIRRTCFAGRFADGFYG